MKWRRMEQAAADEDHGIIATGKWSGRQSSGGGQLIDGKDGRTAKVSDHNAAGLGLIHRHKTVNDIAMQRRSEREGWRREQRREESNTPQARSSGHRCSSSRSAREAGGENCSGRRNMEAEGSGSVKRWMRSSGPDD